MYAEESLSVYPFDEIAGPVTAYSFETTQAIVYTIAFIPTPYLLGEGSVFAPYIYELAIKVSQNNTNKRPPFDRLTARTVAVIFDYFYRRNDLTVILYICDSSDNRQLLRHSAFNRWFRDFKGQEYVKIDEILADTKGDVYPVSLILKDNNPHKIQIIEAFLRTTLVHCNLSLFVFLV